MSEFAGGISGLERALRYPYERPEGSFVYVDGEIRPYGDPGTDIPDEPRTAVIAYGSNVARDQLRYKFGAYEGVVIPSRRVELVDIDVVYAPFLSYYGALPATLAVVPGIRAEAWVQLLPDRLLPVMHRSEARGTRYDYGRLLEPDGRRRDDDARVYWSRDGCLADERGPIPIASVRARGRSRSARGQREVQAWAQAALGEAGELDAFVGAGIESGDVRARRREGLRAYARARDEERFEIIPPGEEPA